MLKPASTGSRDAARNQFLRTFLHDLATPLSAVSLHLEGANRRLARGEDPSSSLDVARAELGRAFDLFERGRELLLSESRPAESIAFDEWVADTFRRMSQDGLEAQGKTGGRIAGDREKLTEALSSLIVNALERARPQEVAVFCERDGHRLQVRVENPGSLPAEDPEKLFAPRSTGGGKNWGMGLPLARLYAADADGVVRVTQSGEKVSATLSFPEENA